jgi:hypothetical protein
MKKLIISLLILLFAPLCWAGSVTDMHKSVIAARNVASGGCASGTVDSSSDFIDHTPGDSNGNLYSTSVVGQSFQVSENGNIYSVVIYVSAATGTANITIRWGPSSDLTDATGTYYDEVTVSNISSADDYEFILPNHDAITASTTYYIGFMASTNTTLYIRRDADDGYAGGAYYYSAAGWDMATTVGSVDCLFAVKLCD